MSVKPNKNGMSTIFLAILATSTVAGCTRGSGDDATLKFLPGSASNLVVVEPQDLSDTFLFGAIVTGIDDSSPAELIGLSSDNAKLVNLAIKSESHKKYLTISGTDAPRSSTSRSPIPTPAAPRSTSPTRRRRSPPSATSASRPTLSLAPRC